jgi:mono/diheme cytochrome c family protein
MNTRAVTNDIHTFFFRLILITAILLPGMAAISPLWTLADSVRAGSREERQQGAALFHEKGCERCHGINGVGTAKAPDLRTIGKRWKKSQIEHQIVNGGFEMPPFHDALDQDEVKSLVAYLSARRALPKNP